jgi:hypothetical protein
MWPFHRAKALAGVVTGAPLAEVPLHPRLPQVTVLGTGADGGGVVVRSHLENPAADERELSAIRLAEAVLAAEDVIEPHRRELLGIAVWKYTDE